MSKKPASEKKVNIVDLQKKRYKGEPITMVTAYDLSSARLADAAGIDMILVGDSLGMVMLGYKTTVPVTMEEMLHHAKAVARGSKRAFLVGDLPFMSYQAERSEAIRNAGLMLKEGLMDAVKLEGGGQDTATIRSMVAAGIPVMGHIGLTPQTISQLGGYRIQGRTVESAQRLLEDALALEEAGCFAIVLELVPAEVARIVTEKLRVPTIGIGAGAGCAGQVLVYHDMLGLFDDFQPRFVKRYAEVGPMIQKALEEYRDDVAARRFPGNEHTYEIPEEALEAFRKLVDG